MVSFAGVAGMALVLLPGNLASQQPERLRERMNDVPTPGVLQGLATGPANRLDVPVPANQEAIPSAWELDPSTGSYYRSGELLVRFKEGTGGAAQAVALRDSGASRVAKVLPEGWEIVELAARTPETDALTAIRESGVVENASLNYRMTTFQARPNDEFFRIQWNFEAVDLPLAWEINPGASSAVIVAVVDTGLNTVTDTFTFFGPFGAFPARFAAVPDLITSSNVVRPFDFVYRDAFPVDLGGHGTHVAGTIAQATNNSLGVAGVAYNVRLMPLKVLSGGSFGSWDDIFFPNNRAGSFDLVAEAIRYAADNGAHVINLSLGGTSPAPIVRDAISYAVGRGAFVAIAAGNDGNSGNPREYPAAYGSEINGAMTVGAVNRSMRRAIYSGFQPYVEICAPGGETRVETFDYEQGIAQVTYDEGPTLSFLSPNQKLNALRLGFRPRFDQFIVSAYQGTSMATPHVAGIAALLYSQGITNPAAIEEAIELFARPINATANECGAGLIDPRGTLRGLGLAR